MMVNGPWIDLQRKWKTLHALLKVLTGPSPKQNSSEKEKM